MYKGRNTCTGMERVMKITNMKCNRIENPLGFALEEPSLSWITEDTEAKVQEAAQILVAEDEAMRRSAVSVIKS